VTLPSHARVHGAVDRNAVPTQRALVTRKSQTLLHATGAVTAAGGGAFIAMSEAVAALSDAAMSNVEMPATLSEVRFMRIP
jgi:hypothetical protein